MRETKTVQVYPDDDIVNATIEEYGSFGWEAIGNQRCQEYAGQTYEFGVGSTNHYSTFNKITFSREKDSPWYAEVSQIERQYNTLKDTVKSYKAQKPSQRTLRLSGLAAFMVGLLLYVLYIIPGIIFSVVRGCKKSKYKKEYQANLAAYESTYPAKIRELETQQAQLRARAQNCIAGKA